MRDHVARASTGGGARLDAAAALLWPQGEMVTDHRRAGAGGSTVEMYVMPSCDKPRLLVPAGYPQASAMLERHSETKTGAVARAVVAATVRHGLARYLPFPRAHVHQPPGAASIETHLSAILGVRVSVGVMLGPPRPNAKPVLQLFDPTGSTVGFAKLSTNELTRMLVAHEGDSLTRLLHAPLGSVQVPRPLHWGSWQGETLLVLEPVPTGTPPPGQGVPTSAMADVARALGTRYVPVQTISAGLRDSLLASQAAQRQPSLLAALDAIDALGGEEQVEIGASHGDWSLWNMSTRGSHVAVWDWERFQTSVPVGFDAVHFTLEQLLPVATDGPDLARRMGPPLTRALPEMGVRKELAALVTCLYLAHILTRYTIEGGDTPGPRLERRMHTLLAAQAALLSTIKETTGP